MGALQNERFCSAPFMRIQRAVEEGDVEKTARILLLWHSKASPGGETGAKCGTYSLKKLDT